MSAKHWPAWRCHSHFSKWAHKWYTQHRCRNFAIGVFIQFFFDWERDKERVKKMKSNRAGALDAKISKICQMISSNILNPRVYSIGLIPFDFIRCNSWLDVNFFTKYADMTKPLLKSVHHDTFILFATVGDNLTFVVILTGRGGLFGSTPGLFVGMGFYDWKFTIVKMRQ